MRKVASVIALLATVALAVPWLVSYQGRLTDDQGNPFEGQAQMEFSLYEAETGGVAFWQEAQTVQVKEGIFNILLGSMMPLEGFPPECWLEVEVAGEILPRQRIASVPYAYQADLLNPRYVLGDSVVEVDVSEPSVLWIGAGATLDHSFAGVIRAWVEVDGDTVPFSKKETDLASWGTGIYSVLIPFQADTGEHILKLRCSGGFVRYPYLWVLVSGPKQ